MQRLAAGCDAHVHVVGEMSCYPMSPARHYTPAPASMSDLVNHLARLGMERCVLVQPSIYGTDNQCLLDALGELSNVARAVVVVDRNIDAAALARLDRQGVRGIRLNLESVGAYDPKLLNSELIFWAPRLADFGWHIQMYAPQRLVADCAETIASLPVPCVVDHIAMWPDPLCEGADSRAVLQLLDTGKLYIKLSASYRVPLSESQLQAVIDRLVATRPDRMLWASDWPHTSRRADAAAHEISPYRPIDAHQLVAQRERWLADEALIHQVCVDNPRRLYRFD